MTEEIAKAQMEPQAQQTIFISQNKTILDAQQMMLEFKETTEEMAKDRVELLNIIEGLKANQEAQEAEMTRLKVFHLCMIKHNLIHVLGAEGVGGCSCISNDQAWQCNGYSPSC